MLHPALIRHATPPPPASSALTARWYPLRYHAEQHRLTYSPARFKVVPSGRRSGKTELTKRNLTIHGIVGGPTDRYFVAAPTWEQAKRLYWQDLKALSPRDLVAACSDGELWIRYVGGAEVHVLGADKPSRLEGSPWSGGVLDEYPNMKPEVWDQHIRPMMAETGGWCWFIGTPEGRNHYYRLYTKACGIAKARQAAGLGHHRAAVEALMAAGYDEAEAAEVVASGVFDWDAFAWPSSDILPADEIRSAKRDMSPDIFEQEFGAAKFASFRGLAYHCFDEERNTAPVGHLYNPKAPLIVALDFNVEPGTAAIAQELTLPNGEKGTAWIDEVWIPFDSNTDLVCAKVLSMYEGHMGPVKLYGDSTGGARKTSAVEGPDWKLVRQAFRGKFNPLLDHVPKQNPPPREMINCTNARLQAADGTVRMMVDPLRCPHIVEDFAGVRLVEGGSGEIDKGKRNEGITHLCFKPGTLISTPAGAMPIERVKTGDLVDTPLGPAPLIAAVRGKVRAQMVRISASGGGAFVCTPDHRVLTQRGWLEAGHLRPGCDMLLEWTSKSSRLQSKSSTGSPTVSAATAGILREAMQGCIGLSGNTTVGPSKMDYTSTTSTEIAAITRFLISIYYQRLITWRCMLMNPRGWRRAGRQSILRELLPLSGIGPKLAGLGTESSIGSMATRFTRSATSTSANRAARAIETTRSRVGFAADPARTRFATGAGSMMFLLSVDSAASPSKPTSTSTANIAAFPAQTVLGVESAKDDEPVCISVPLVGCFRLASGVIVSNSDGISAYCAERWPIADQSALGVARIAVPPS